MGANSDTNIEDFPFIKDKYLLEPLPHLIVMPGTLRSQWVHELQTLFRPKSIDIFLYNCPKSGNEEFWSASGPFAQSRQSPENKIILTTMSVSMHHLKLLASMC